MKQDRVDEIVSYLRRAWRAWDALARNEDEGWDWNAGHANALLKAARWVERKYGRGLWMKRQSNERSKA